MIIERVLILLAAALLVGAVGWLWQRWREQHLNGVHAGDVAGTSSVPTVLYFTAEWCGQGRLQQRPIIESLLASMNDCVRVREVDVESDTQLAQRFGVVTLPTTVVVAPSGRVVARNTGVARQPILNTQIQQALPGEC